MEIESPYDLPELPAAISSQPLLSLGVHSTQQTSTPPIAQPTSTLEKIEAIFEDLTESIVDGRTLKIPFRSRPRSRETRTTEYDILDRGRGLQYPGPSAKEAWKFAVIVRILELIHDAIVKNYITTKRDIFYKDVNLFSEQTAVDRYIDDIAYNLGVQRADLNVVAAAKGLVAGIFSISRQDGVVVDGRSEQEGLSIPKVQDTDRLDLWRVRWILVIEKEAIFRSLASSRFYSSGPSNGIILTGKGYPDISTRAFLHRLSSIRPLIPIYALVDFDPDGIGIMSTYKHGSMSLAHENNMLKVPSVRWLGVKSADIMASISSDAQATRDRNILKLTSRDRVKAIAMLDYGACAEEGDEAEWRNELQKMLMMNVKAEIQSMSEAGLEEWLRTKLEGS